MALEDYEWGLVGEDADGNVKDVKGRVGWWELNSDGTFTNLLTGNTHDPEDIGSGGSSSDTRVDIEDDNTSVQTDASVLDVKTGFNAAADGNGGADLTLDLDVQDGGTSVTKPPTVLDYAAYLAATEPASNEAEVAFDEVQWLVDHPERTGVKLLEDTENYDISVPVPDGQTLEVYRWGVWKVADYTTPTGLEVQLLDGGDTVQSSANATDQQDTATPVASLANSSGSTSLYKLRLSNATGSNYTTDGVGGHFGYRVV